MVSLNLPDVLQLRDYYRSTAYNSHFSEFFRIILQEVNAILPVIFTIIVVD
jgi:hypothetical protein